MYLEPIHLTAKVSNLASGSNAPQAIALKNPRSRPIAITEVLFTLQLYSAGGDAGNRLNGGAVSCQFDAAGRSLTNGAIPLWSFGQSINFAREQQTAGISVKWLLDYPVYLKPEEVLQPTFTHRGLSSDIIDVRVSYSGTEVNGIPRTRMVPLVSTYISKVMSVSAADIDQSKETDLANISGKVLWIKRVTGRLSIFNNTTLANVENLVPIVGNHLLQVRAVNSSGQVLVRYPTPFHKVFDPQTCSMESVAGQLQPNEFINVYLAKAASSVVPAAAYMCQSMISTVGYYEVSDDA